MIDKYEVIVSSVVTLVRKKTAPQPVPFDSSSITFTGTVTGITNSSLFLDYS